MANEPRFEVYPYKGNESPTLPPHDQFGWRFRAGNGQITATGGEGYTRREDVDRAIHDFLDAVDPEGAGTDRTHAPIIDVDD